MALKPISRIAAGVQASTTLVIDSLFKQMKAEGKDVVGFGAGEPDFPTPEHIKQAGIEAIETNQTKYTPAAGLMELREAACYRLKTDFGLEYEPKQIVVASGAKHSVYVALMTLCNPGDEVVIAAPYWVSYSEMVKQAGAVPVIVTAEEEQDFKITAAQLDAAITDKTKVFMLNSPCNPTGMVYTRAELEAIAEVCCRRNIYVIADEIYCNLVYDDIEFVSFAPLSEDVKERTLIVVLDQKGLPYGLVDRHAAAGRLAENLDAVPAGEVARPLAGWIGVPKDITAPHLLESLTHRPKAQFSLVMDGSTLVGVIDLQEFFDELLAA